MNPNSPTDFEHSTRAPKFSLGKRVVGYVFSFYLLIAILVTITQMYVEFHRVQDNLIEEMGDIAQTISPGLSEQLWNIDGEGVARALNRIVLNGKILGIQAFDKIGRRVSHAGVIPHAVGEAAAPDGNLGSGLFNKLVSVDLAIDYRDEDDGFIHRVGRVVIYTGESVAFEQVKYGFILIVINSVIKTAALWIIMVFFINKLIERPLDKLGSMTRRFEPSAPQLKGKDEAEDKNLRARKDQVGQLMISFEEMQKKILRDFDLINNQKQLIQDDMIELERTQRALSESEQLQRDVFNNTSSVIYIKDLDGHYMFVNHMFERLLNVTKSEIIQKTDYDIFPKEMAEAFRSNDLKTIDAGEIMEFEETSRHDDGDHTYIAVKFPLKRSTGEIYAICGISTDITERKQLENQLRQSQKMEAVGQLTGGVAHDFNNLLAAIMSNAQMLELDLKGRDDLQNLASSIVSESQRGAELTHRLLAFSRQQFLTPKSIHLGALCGGMHELLKRSLGETVNIDIITRGKPWNVLADPGQVENALLNLAINASHAMPRGGDLQILIENAPSIRQEFAQSWGGHSGDYVALRVIDAGTGITEKDLKYVFEPFFTTKEVGKGSGLGLSMVYGFAQQSGGFVTIETEEGKGTMVSIYLPKVKDERTGPEDQTKGDELQQGRGETILLVEDQAAVREAITKVLKRLGYTVLAAEDGVAALTISSNADRIDLLLTDMVLPGGMNGIEICHRIREQEPRLKCLFMSGYASLPDQQLPEGANILSKPIDMGELAARMSQILGG